MVDWVTGGTAAASAVGGIFNKKSDKAKQKGISDANDLQWQMYQRNRADMEPWRTAGAGAVQKLSTAIDTGPPDYTQTPGYTFRLNEGNKNINRNAQLLGNMGSGGHEKALMKFGQDYATNDFDNNINRWLSTKVKPWQSVAGLGQQSAHATANLGFATGENMSELALDRGDVRASGYTGMGNAISGAMGGVFKGFAGGKGLGGGGGGGGFGDPSSASYYR